MFPLRATRRAVLALPAISLAAAAGPIRTGAQITPGFGVLVATSEPGRQLVLHDAASGAERFAFDLGAEPNAAWKTDLPGVALARTERGLFVVDGNNGFVVPVAVPETVAGTLAPNGIQFRGSLGHEKVLVGTPNSDADTYLIDLLTGERISVVGMPQAEQPPVSLQNVAVAADDLRLLAWDGRTTWIVDLATRTSRVLGSGQFTFSAGFSDDGSQLVYSQQMADGSTQLLLEDAFGNTRLLGENPSAILVSLWIPARDVLLLDERSDIGGTLAVLDPETMNREDVLEYRGATNIVQLSPDGRNALVGIEGDKGRDWYQFSLSMVTPWARLLAGLTDFQVFPGFEFNAGHALGLPPIEPTGEGTVMAIDLTNGLAAPLISGITSDAELTGPIVAASGDAALLKIDSFTELAVHHLRLDQAADIRVDLTKGGGGVIAPDGHGFAVSHGLNAGGMATVVYDQTGAERATFRGNALAWI
jgi:hypothetical protein